MRLGALRPRPALRAEPGLRGYRAMIAVIVVIALVVLGAVTGAFHRVLCLADSSACDTAAPVTAPTGAVELPAASDERAVVAAAGTGTLTGGTGHAVVDRSAVPGAQTAPSWSDLWSDGQDEDEAAGPVGFGGEGVLVPLEELSCGSPGTSPCDAWEGLSSDASASRAAGLLRAPLLGLDNADPTGASPVAVDLALPVRDDAELDAVGPVLHRSVLAPDTGATTLTWTWQRRDGAIVHVVAERRPDGSLSTLTVSALIRASAPDGASGGLERTELVVPVTPASSAALDSWLVDLAAQRVDPEPSDLTDVDPADLSANAFERLAALTGEGLRESVVLPDGAAFTAEWVRDNPLLEGSQRLPLAERSADGQWEPVS